MLYIIREEGKKKEWLILTMIYCISHGMLLFVTGRWWDDWCLYNESKEALRLFASQMGRPFFYYIISFTKLLPEVGCRIITFLAFYFCIFFLYKILRKWIEADYKMSFWICALYAIIPVNDIRILQGAIPYSIGLFFFMAGFSHLSGLLYDNKMNWRGRIFNLVLFFCSFSMNSNLVFYAVVLLMILTHEKSIKKMVRYIDYIVLPIIFYVFKAKFFPAWGSYADYNILTIKKIILALINILPADARMMASLVYNWLSIGKRWILIIVVAVFLFLIITNYKKLWLCFVSLYRKSDNFGSQNLSSVLEMDEIKKLRRLLLLGVVILSAGLFSYVTIRQSYIIETVGKTGRDAILVSFGAALIIYCIAMLLFHREVAHGVFLVIIMCGIVHFNLYYLSYQEDYYRQLGFQYQLKQHTELANLTNMFYLNSDSGRINFSSFYHLNGNAEIAYGNQSRMIISNFDEATLYFKSGDNSLLKDFVECDNYHMSDYDYNYNRIDAILEYSFNSNISATAKMKWYEFFDYEHFKESLRNKSSLNVFLDGSAEYDAFLHEAGYEN